MHVVIVGAGSMGTLIAHGIAKTNHHLTLIDTPARQQQMAGFGGLPFRDLNNHEHLVNARLVIDFASAVSEQPADVVILATKSHVLPTIAAQIASICTAQTIIVPIQNGIPWWYLFDAPEPFSLQPTIRSVEPDGSLSANLDPSAILGCVAYPAAQIDKQGVVTHVEGIRFPVGELNGQTTARAEMVAALFNDAQFKSRVINDIHAEIWLKCWGALSINIISALTRATMADICNHEGTEPVVREMMCEAQKIAEALGLKLRHTVDKRIEGARSVGQHKTSTLQDVEMGRPMGLQPILGAVIELGDRTGIATPTLRTIYACADLLNQSLLKQTA